MKKMKMTKIDFRLRVVQRVLLILLKMHHCYVLLIQIKTRSTPFRGGGGGARGRSSARRGNGRGRGNNTNGTVNRAVRELVI